MLPTRQLLNCLKKILIKMPFKFSDKFIVKRLEQSWTEMWCWHSLILNHHIISVKKIILCLHTLEENLDGDKNNPNWGSWYISENSLVNNSSKSRVISSSKLFLGICIWQNPDRFPLYYNCPQGVLVGFLKWTTTAVSMNYSTRQNSSSEGLHFVDSLVLSILSVM